VVEVRLRGERPKRGERREDDRRDQGEREHKGNLTIETLLLLYYSLSTNRMIASKNREENATAPTTSPRLVIRP
jgi:hypothetical protein